jgi:hypothetical protein
MRKRSLCFLNFGTLIVRLHGARAGARVARCATQPNSQAVKLGDEKYLRYEQPLSKVPQQAPSTRRPLSSSVTASGTRTAPAPDASF